MLVLTNVKQKPLVPPVLAFCVAALAGCATPPLKSVPFGAEPPEESERMAVYFLPRMQVEFELSASDTPYFCQVKEGSNGEPEVIEQSDQHIDFVERTFELSFGDGRSLPDPSAGYTLHYAHSSWSSDTVAVEIDADGLIAKVDLKIKDESGASILKVVEAVKEVKKAFIAFGRADQPSVSVVADCRRYRAGTAAKTVLLESNFDPQRSASVDTANATISSVIKQYSTREWGMQVEVARSSDQLAIEVDPAPTAIGRPHARGGSVDGIAYRPATPVHLIARAAGVETNRKTILVPDQKRTAYIDINRADLVEKLSVLEFENGILQKVNTTKPSEALAIATLPVEVLKAVVSIPAELVQFKIDTTDDEQKLVDAQKKLIDTQKQLLETEQQLIEKQREITAKNQPEEEGDDPFADED